MSQMLHFCAFRPQPSLIDLVGWWQCGMADVKDLNAFVVNAIKDPIRIASGKNNTHVINIGSFSTKGLLSNPPDNLIQTFNDVDGAGLRVLIEVVKDHSAIGKSPLRDTHFHD